MSFVRWVLALGLTLATATSCAGSVPARTAHEAATEDRAVDAPVDAREVNEEQEQARRDLQASIRSAMAQQEASRTETAPLFRTPAVLQVLGRVVRGTVGAAVVAATCVGEVVAQAAADLERPREPGQSACVRVAEALDRDLRDDE